MQIQKVRSTNSNNINFVARLKISGSIDDISSKQLKDWSKKAQLVGVENDMIELIFGEPIAYVSTAFGKYKPKNIKKNNDNFNKKTIIKRTISSNIYLANGKEIKYKPHSYWSKFSKDINEKDKENCYKKLTNLSVSKLLETLKMIVAKNNN